MAGFGMPIAGEGIGMIGNLAGGLISDSMLGQGLYRAGRRNQQGIDYLKQGNEQQRGDFAPYMEAGQRGLGRFEGALDQGSGAQGPQQSGAFSFDRWQDPSAQYTMDQANRAINASAIAKGAVGGGLGKALAANSANLAGQQYQNAFQRYLAQNQQDFGQQQQQFANAQDTWKTRLGGYQGMAERGQQAAGTTGQLGLGYGQGVASGYQKWGEQELQNAGDRAGVMGKTISGLGRDMGSLFGGW